MASPSNKIQRRSFAISEHCQGNRFTTSAGKGDPYEIFVVALLLACACIAQLGLRASAQMRSNTGPYAKMEAKARKSNPVDRQTVRDLAHEILSLPHTYPIPQPINTLLEERLTTAEINFRQGNGPGVSETQLVDLCNWIHQKLRLPAYLTTTPAQMRMLRMKLAISAPYTMGDTLTGADIRKGQHIHTEMSPLQAMHLLSVMIDQKILNPSYQDPSIDLVVSERKRIRSSTQSKPKLTTLDRNDVAKRLEIQSAISSSTSAMSLQDTYEVVHHALTTLHLE